MNNIKVDIKAVILMFQRQKPFMRSTNILQYRYYCSNLLVNKKHLTETSSFSPEDFNERMVKVAIVGAPNAGKSTFINNLVGRRVCAASSKVHTTRDVSKAFCVEGNAQIVFLDTPGLVTPKEQKRHQLEASFVNSFKSCMEAADIIGVVHDVSNSWTRDRLDYKVLRLLEKYNNVPSFLVLNKIDLMKSKRKLLDLTKALTENILSTDNVKSSLINDVQKKVVKGETCGWAKFANVFMVSSLSGSGLDEIKEYLVSLSKPCTWKYSPAEYSDLSNEDVIVQAVKAKLLDFMPQEIPYQLVTEIEHYHLSDNGCITAEVLVTCPSPRIQKLLEGTSNGKIKQIMKHVNVDLHSAFYQPVNINITVCSKSENK